MYNMVWYNVCIEIAEWCNGSTADSDSVCEGSNPSSAAMFSIDTARGFTYEK